MSFKPQIGDASTIKKGLVQLAGDLGGTAGAPTVPGLTGKADSSHIHPLVDLPVNISVDEYQASNGSWPSTTAEATRRVNWIGYPGLSTPPNGSGRPAAVAGLDSYVLREN